MNNIVFSTSMLNPIIIYDRSHNPNVKYFIYYLNTDWTFCTCIKVSQTYIYIYIVRALHIMINLDDSQLLRVYVSFHESINDENLYFLPSLQNDENVILSLSLDNCQGHDNDQQEIKN